MGNCEAKFDETQARFLAESRALSSFASILSVCVGVCVFRVPAARVGSQQFI